MPALLKVTTATHFGTLFCTSLDSAMSKRLRTSDRLVAVKQENAAKVTATETSNVRTGGRDNKKIMKKWWNDHRREHASAMKEKEKVEALLASERVCLESERQLVKQLSEENNKLKEIMEENAALKELLAAKNMPAMLKKEKDRPTLLKMLGEAILFIFSVVMNRTQGLTRLRALVEVVFDNNLFGAFETDKVLKEVTTKYARKTVFVPWRVLRSIDLAINGGINFTGIEALRKAEELGSHQRGMLPSRGMVQKCAMELHVLGQELIPFERLSCPLGEMYKFHHEKMVRFILKAFSLHEIAQQESVELCITLDGAELTKDLCHLTFGIKVTDSRAIDPRDGTPLACQEDGIYGQLFKVQSRNYCFIMKTLLGKDSKDAYKAFGDVFKFFETLQKEGLPANEHGPRIMPIIIWSPQDLSSIWKSLNTGSGARKSGCSHWCHLCPCTGNKIASFLVDENRFVILFALLMNNCEEILFYSQCIASFYVFQV